MKLLPLQEKVLYNNYQHAGILKELKQQLIKEYLKYTDTQSFHILMGLIRLSEKRKK